MKVITREFTSRESVLLLVLGIIILGLVYYIAVDQPVRNGIAEAQAEKESLEMQAQILDKKVAEIATMKNELESLDSTGGQKAEMPSYNANKKEVDFMNMILGGTIDYYIGFNNVTREGDQVRRDFTIHYKCNNHDSAVNVLKSLENGYIRCLIGDVSFSSSGDENDGIKNMMSGETQVSCSATFYETMHDGKEDSELPADTSAAQ